MDARLPERIAQRQQLFTRKVRVVAEELLADLLDLRNGRAEVFEFALEVALFALGAFGGGHRLQFANEVRDGGLGIEVRCHGASMP